jgi:hypothetical protein
VPDLSSLLLAAIEETERLVRYRDEDWRTDQDSWHTRACGYGQGELLDECDCKVPSAVLRRCAADRRRLARHTALPRIVGDPRCSVCPDLGYPCPELLNLAEGYGITDHQEGEAHE